MYKCVGGYFFIFIFIFWFLQWFLHDSCDLLVPLLPLVPAVPLVSLVPVVPLHWFHALVPVVYLFRSIILFHVGLHEALARTGRYKDIAQS